MPRADQLPDDIREFAYRHAFDLRHSNWHSDVNEMLKRLGLTKSNRRYRSAALAIVGIVLVAIGLYLFRESRNGPAPIVPADKIEQGAGVTLENGRASSRGDKPDTQSAGVSSPSPGVSSLPSTTTSQSQDPARGQSAGATDAGGAAGKTAGTVPPPVEPAVPTSRECQLGKAGAPVNALALSPDARYVFTAVDDGRLLTWSTACPDRQPTPDALWQESSGAQSVAVDASGTRLAASWSGDALIRMWSLTTGGGAAPRVAGAPSVLDGHPGPIVGLGFTSGTEMYSASEGVVQQWHVDIGEDRPGRAVRWSGRSLALGSSRGVITALAAAPRSGWVAAVSAAGSIALWNGQSPSPVRVLTSTCRNIRSVALTAAGTLAAGCADGTLLLCGSGRSVCQSLDAEGEGGATIAGSGGAALTAVSFDATGMLLVTGDTRGRLTIRAANSGAVVEGSDGHGTAGITAAAFSAVGRRLVSADDDGAIRVWDLPPPR